MNGSVSSSPARGLACLFHLRLPCSRTPDGQKHTMYPIYRTAEDGRRHMPRSGSLAISVFRAIYYACTPGAGSRWNRQSVRPSSWTLVRVMVGAISYAGRKMELPWIVSSASICSLICSLTDLLLDLTSPLLKGMVILHCMR